MPGSAKMQEALLVFCLPHLSTVAVYSNSVWVTVLQAYRILSHILIEEREELSLIEEIVSYATWTRLQGDDICGYMLRIRLLKGLSLRMFRAS